MCVIMNFFIRKKYPYILVLDPNKKYIVLFDQKDFTQQQASQALSQIKSSNKVVGIIGSNVEHSVRFVENREGVKFAKNYAR